MKLFLQIIAILLIVSTISICAIKPARHNTVLVYNSDYKLLTEDDVKLEPTQMPVMEMPAKPQVQTVQKKVETVNIPNTQKTIQKVKTNKSADTKPTTVTKTVTNKTVQQPVQTSTKQEQKEPVKVVQTQTQTPPKVLTQREEEIAWNVWRSNLQNKIMQDVKLPILPNGIVFRFSFNVDKYGKITNIYTSSDNPAFTPYAIQYIAPVIRSYQGKSILNFPEGSSRTATEFKGGWKISSSERLSTPQDYNDYEKVTRNN